MNWRGQLWCFRFCWVMEIVWQDCGWETTNEGVVCFSVAVVQVGSVEPVRVWSDYLTCNLNLVWPGVWVKVGWVKGQTGLTLWTSNHYVLLLILENSGSVARDHLASERTCLAYVRTSLTITSMGVGEWYFLEVGLRGRGQAISKKLTDLSQPCWAFCGLFVTFLTLNLG